ncbi:hypothetical protein [Uliginosibacterium sp. H1]|nr:hypothetical protein [Uliginosibacterium sp. H1]
MVLPIACWRPDGTIKAAAGQAHPTWPPTEAPGGLVAGRKR